MCVPMRAGMHVCTYEGRNAADLSVKLRAVSLGLDDSNTAGCHPTPERRLGVQRSSSYLSCSSLCQLIADINTTGCCPCMTIEDMPQTATGCKLLNLCSTWASLVLQLGFSLINVIRCSFSFPCSIARQSSSGH